MKLTWYHKYKLSFMIKNILTYAGMKIAWMFNSDS